MVVLRNIWGRGREKCECVNCGEQFLDVNDALGHQCKEDVSMATLFRNCPNQVAMQCVGCGMLFLSFISARAHEGKCPKEQADAKASQQQPAKPSAYEALEGEHKPAKDADLQV